MNFRLARNATALFLSQVALWPSLELAHAAGGTSVELESASYFNSSNDRPNSGNKVLFRPDFQSTGEVVESRLDLRGAGYLSSGSSFTVEAVNLYVSTSQEFSNLHQLTLGRRQTDWSVADDRWKLGTWSPRFMWDPLRPESTGLTGLTYQYRSKLWTMRVFASPISIPERGVPIVAHDGKLSSADPDWAKPYEQVGLGAAMGNANVPIRYSIHYPELSKLIVHPSTLMQVRYGEERSGPWSSVTLGVKPIHPADITVDAALKLQPDQYISADLYPRVVYHRLGTFEAGVRDQNWNLWGSLSREEPIPDSLPSGRVSAGMGPAWITSAGVDYTGLKNVRLSTSFLNIEERVPPPSDNSVPITVPSRFALRRALALGADWSPSWRLAHSLQYTRDFNERNGWISIDTAYRISHGRWRVGVGADLFTSGSSGGQFGPYAGNDRIRGKLIYDF